MKRSMTRHAITAGLFAALLLALFRDGCEGNCTSSLSCEDSDFDCMYSDCDPMSMTEEATCEESWKGDSWCDEINNNPSCDYDEGDCCECSCASSSSAGYSCGENGFNCRDTTCLDLSLVAEFPDCTGDYLTVGDGSCSEANNNDLCGYDGGDCCVCSCQGVNCMRTSFECLDPSANEELHDCEPSPQLALPCTADAQQTWVVESSTQAQALAAAVNCSGGLFEVEWRGRVVVGEPFYVVDGTVLTISGADSSAVVEGNASTRMFTVVNADLYLSHVNVSYGSSTTGGAIAAARSSLTLNGTNFVGNTASAYGGAIYVSDGSSVYCVGSTFSGNEAGIDGGAMYVTGSSVVSGGGTWVNNTAGDSGGALRIQSGSSASWGEESMFGNNTAGRAGGAVSIDNGSGVSWSGPNDLFSNSAGLFGGALSSTHGSSASWSDLTTHANNWVGDLGYGGALYLCNGSMASFSAQTAFLGNEAGYNGGAVFVDEGSAASWRGEAMILFERNRAGRFGGALAVSARSRVSCTTETTSTFFDNSAFDGGGAILVELDSSLSFGGNTSFESNRALGDLNTEIGWGGALHVDGSNASSSGRVKFTGNSARYGGALYVLHGSVGWSGETILAENDASVSGGAVFSGFSAMSWFGDTQMLNNSAGTGGALYLSSSVAMWDGNTTMTENRVTGVAAAGGIVCAVFASTIYWSGGLTRFIGGSSSFVGGALYVSGSEVTWSGGTEFSGNTALLGGAIYMLNGTSVGWTEHTEFTSNRALAEGGAVMSPSYDSEYNSLESSLVINGTTSFFNNTCGENGGSLALFDGCSLDINTADVSFTGNSAGVAGGAVFVSGAGIGPTFSDVSFISNFAQVGGAASVFGSGNDRGMLSPIIPTKFDRCRFIDNVATASGGAVDSAAGQDIVVNSIFKGNSAEVGGALRLAGTAFVENCSFVENVSGHQEGAAVSNIGLVSTMANSSFTGNGFTCGADLFLEYDATDNGTFEAVCDGCRVACDGCSFDEPPAVPTCSDVMDHGTSTGGNVTLETLSIDPGYWRATSSSKEILPCYNADACLGGVTGTAGYCLESYEGPYCSICSDGYASNLGYSCSKCFSRSGGIVFALGMAVLALFVAVVVITYIMSGEAGERRMYVFERLGWYVPLQSVKIVIVSWQILTQFASAANVVYPGVYQQFLDGLKVFGFDLGWLLSAGCVLDIDFHGRLLAATIGPIFAVLLLAGTYAAATRINREADEKLQIIWDKHVFVFLLLTFLVYSSVSSTVFKTFACDELEDGKNYLRTDYRIECDSSKHKVFQVYAGFMILLYPLGIPMLYSIMLFRDREVLKKDKADRDDSARVKSTSELWQPYKPSVFYYEVIECGRRILLTGIVVFIYPNTAAQLAITLMMAFFFALLSEAISPYSSRWETWVNRMCHVVVAVSMYVALLLKVDVSDERADSQSVFEAVLVTVHACMILSVVVETFVVAGLWTRRLREDVPARFRRGKFLFRGGV
ncbi:unnamed protein product [Ectocarpus sp. 6 AP-2014]